MSGTRFCARRFHPQKITIDIYANFPSPTFLIGQENINWNQISKKPCHMHPLWIDRSVVRTTTSEQPRMVSEKGQPDDNAPYLGK